MENKEEKYVYFVIILITLSLFNYLLMQSIKEDIKRIDNNVMSVYDELECLKKGDCMSDEQILEEFLKS